MWIYTGLWLVVSAMPSALAQDSAEEKRLLKAAFIYNFAKFTRWPDTVWGRGDDPLHLCIAGEDQVIGALKQLGGKTIKGRNVSIRPLTEAHNPGDCHVLYVASSEQDQYLPIVDTMRNAPVLTVSEIPRFGRSGGIIELFQEKERIRFIVNQGASRMAGLKLNSRLLNLAVVID